WPLPPAGTGNISIDPQLVGTAHVAAASPCRGAGNAAYASGTDIDGESWADPPSIGCDEVNAGALTGPIGVSFTLSYTNVPVGYPVDRVAAMEGGVTEGVGDLGEGARATNQTYVTRAWTALGDYPVVLTAYNESQPAGVSAAVIVHVVVAPVLYVAADSTNP